MIEELADYLVRNGWSEDIADDIHDAYGKGMDSLTEYAKSISDNKHDYTDEIVQDIKLWQKENDDMEFQLNRQNYTCYGCLKKISKIDGNASFCHITGKFKGMLCNSCVQVLDCSKNDKSTLRRLMAYLDYDKSKLSVYLMGALKNELRIPEIGNVLRAEGYVVMDEWITPGEHADENWQRYEKIRGRNYQEALKGIAATNIFLFDRSYIDISDVGILVLPCGKSAFLELGYAKGCGKKTFILLDGQEPSRYDIMPNFADKVCFDLDELKTELKKIKIN